MSFQWNVVNRTGEAGDALHEELRHRVSRLEKFLSHFPGDTVHLQIVLHPRRSDRSYAVTLNLRVPSDVLQVRKSSPVLFAAVDEAVRTLQRRLERLRSRYRRDHLWKTSRGRKQLLKQREFTVEPAIAGVGPQTWRDLIANLLRQDYDRLVGFVNRQLSEYLLSDTIPLGAIDPADIVAGVAEEVLGNPDKKPTSMDYRTWSTSLAFQMTQKTVEGYLTEAHRAVPIDLEIHPEEHEVPAADLDPEEFALNLLQDSLEPDETTVGDITPDPRATPPDVGADEKDMIAALRDVIRRWPRLDRQIFEMHFLEGLSADDLAFTFGSDRGVIDRRVANIRARLRTRLSQIVDEERGAAPSDESKRKFDSHLESLLVDAKAEVVGGA